MLEGVEGPKTDNPSSDGTHLACGLDEALPVMTYVGKGTVLPLRGWCFSAEAPVSRLEILAGGKSTAVPNHSWGRPDVFMENCPALDPSGNSLLSGFTAFVPIQQVEHESRLSVALRATLVSGRVVERSLGSTLLQPGYGADPLAFDWRADGPRVAICMAAFRPPPALFLNQIASIQAQTHTNWALIVSDDNTENEHFDRLRLQFSDDRRVVFIQNPERLNFYENFQQALRRVPVNAEFVALCDQDDEWRPDKLASLLAAFGERVQLTYSDARLVDAVGTLRSETFWSNRRNNHTDLPTLMVANTITGAASMVRSALLPDILPFPPQIGPSFHDHWIGLVALVRGGIGYVDAPLYDYVQHEESVIGHNFKQMARNAADYAARVARRPTSWSNSTNGQSHA